jgi:hypothetical protein
MYLITKSGEYTAKIYNRQLNEYISGRTIKYIGCKIWQHVDFPENHWVFSDIVDIINNAFEMEVDVEVYNSFMPQRIEEDPDEYLWYYENNHDGTTFDKAGLINNVLDMLYNLDGEGIAHIMNTYFLTDDDQKIRYAENDYWTKEGNDEDEDEVEPTLCFICANLGNCDIEEPGITECESFDDKDTNNNNDADNEILTYEEAVERLTEYIHTHYTTDNFVNLFNDIMPDDIRERDDGDFDLIPY